MFATKALVMRVVVIESRFDVLASRREFKRLAELRMLKRQLKQYGSILLPVITCVHCVECPVSLIRVRQALDNVRSKRNATIIPQTVLALGVLTCS